MTENGAKRLLKTTKACGRPPLWESPEALDAAIQHYFEHPKMRKIIVGKGDKAQAIDIPILTISGLVLSLGFADRCSFYEYESKPQFTYVIKRARERIAQEYEEMLQAGLGAGAIFALKNFGWRDEPTTIIENHTHFTTIQVENMKPEELVDFVMGRGNGRQTAGQPTRQG